jgi:tetratricopeptide (TPR) repeat protein
LLPAVACCRLLLPPAACCCRLLLPAARLFQASPDEPKLWCVLGDIQQQDDHYRRAWEVSRQRSSRAQRSLAKAAVTRKDYAAAAAAYDLALALSPLYPDAWFALGYCHLKMGDNSKALQVKVPPAEKVPAIIIANDGELFVGPTSCRLWVLQIGFKQECHQQLCPVDASVVQLWMHSCTDAAGRGRIVLTAACLSMPG